MKPLITFPIGCVNINYKTPPNVPFCNAVTTVGHEGALRFNEGFAKAIVGQKILWGPSKVALKKASSTVGEGSELLLLEEKWWKRSASTNMAGLVPKAVWGPQFSRHGSVKAWVTAQVPMTCRCNTIDTLLRCSFVVPEVSASYKMKSVNK